MLFSTTQNLHPKSAAWIWGWKLPFSWLPRSFPPAPTSRSSQKWPKGHHPPSDKTPEHPNVINLHPPHLDRWIRIYRILTETNIANWEILHISKQKNSSQLSWLNFSPIKASRNIIILSIVAALRPPWWPASLHQGDQDSLSLKVRVGYLPLTSDLLPVPLPLLNLYTVPQKTQKKMYIYCISFDNLRWQHGDFNILPDVFLIFPYRKRRIFIASSGVYTSRDCKI